MKRIPSFLLVLAVALSLVGHGQTPAPLTGSYEFTGPILDIEATSTGTLLVTDGVTVHEISSSGIADVASIDTVERALINGLGSAVKGAFLASTGGADLAAGAAIWRVALGEVELVASIEDFEIEHDPDALAGSRWKDVACEEDSAQAFTAGPQSNPYHLTTLPDGSALVADAAGNTLLSVSPDGEVDWIAVFEPPSDEDGAWRVLKAAENNPEIECYVQPVPTAVTVGPDGALYVGELTGAPAVPGWSRVWRIEPEARNVVCPSSDCREIASGLTSVIDVLFGADGELYVAELDTAGWLAPLADASAGGAIKKCDVGTGSCEVIEEASGHLGALTFDASGQLWAVENESVFGAAPATVRRVSLP